MNRLLIPMLLAVLMIGCTPGETTTEVATPTETRETGTMEANEFQFALRDLDHGRYREAIPNLQIALQKKLYPESRIRRELGRAYHGAGMYTWAIDQLRLALVDRPNDSQAYAWVADSYMQERRPEMAADYARRGLKLQADPEIEAELHYTLGLANMELGNVEAALEQFEAAQKLQPKDRDVNIELAEAYEEAGQVAKAIEVWKRIHAMVKDDATQAGIVERHILQLQKKLPPKVTSEKK
ncbi:MAG: tetratricopeptide repeat protein [Planctomycetota bacterium]